MKIKNFFASTGISTVDLFLKNLSDTDMPTLISASVQNILSSCPNFISSNATISKTASISGNVYIGSNVTIEDYAVINGPVIIHENTYIGQHSLIRGASIIGKNSIIGHSCEIANSMILNNTTISHYNIISCSLIGNNVNFSAFASTAAFLLKNKNIQEQNIPVQLHNENGESYPANTFKFGSIIGDNCRIGAFCLLNPGVIMEKNCIVYPLLNVSANYYYQNSSIYIEGYRTHFIIQVGERTLNPKSIAPYSTYVKGKKLDD